MMILTDEDMIVTGLRYGIEVDPTDVVQYKLVCVMLHLEQDSPQVLALLRHIADKSAHKNLKEEST